MPLELLVGIGANPQFDRSGRNGPKRAQDITVGAPSASGTQTQPGLRKSRSCKHGGRRYQSDPLGDRGKRASFPRSAPVALPGDEAARATLTRELPRSLRLEKCQQQIADTLRLVVLDPVSRTLEIGDTHVVTKPSAGFGQFALHKGVLGAPNHQSRHTHTELLARRQLFSQ